MDTTTTRTLRERLARSIHFRALMILVVSTILAVAMVGWALLWVWIADGTEWALVGSMVPILVGTAYAVAATLP